MSNYIETDLFQYIILPIVYILIGYGVYSILRYLVDKIFKNKHIRGRDKKRIDTIRILIKNVLKYVVIIFVALIILTVYHVDVKSIIAGLGIGVAVVGLAFQDVLKDILAGISIILENQFEIGDTVEIGGFRGDVVFMGLKTTRLKDYKGAVKIISNRNITEVTNYSLNPSLAVVEIPVRYECDLNQVEKTLSKIIKKLEKEYEDLKGPIDIWGVDRLDNSSVVYKIAVLTKTGMQFKTERKLKRDLKLGLEKDGFDIPYPQVEVHHERENV